MRGKNGVELISDRTLDIASGRDGEAEDQLVVMMEWGLRLAWVGGRAQYSLDPSKHALHKPGVCFIQKGS